MLAMNRENNLAGQLLAPAFAGKRAREEGFAGCDSNILLIRIETLHVASSAAFSLGNP